jgi:hypothetical protein
MSDVKPIDGFDQRVSAADPVMRGLEGVGLFLYGEAKGPIWQWKIARDLLDYAWIAATGARYTLTKEQARDVIADLQRWL